MSNVPAYFRTPHNQAKLGASIVVAALAKALMEGDPGLQLRFLAELKKAYTESRDDWAAVDALEVMKWAAEMVTNDDYGWPIEGIDGAIIEGGVD